MRSRVIALLTVLCTLSLLTPAIAVASNQNLAWGVEIGDRFDLHYKYENYYYPSNSKEFDCYIVVESLPIIPDNIDEVEYPLYITESPGLGAYFRNDTDMGPWAANFPQVIMPIGNWALWSNLLEDFEERSLIYFDSINITETPTTWSWTRSTQYSSDELTGGETSVSFRKSDGVLVYFYSAGLNNYGNKYFEYELTQLGIVSQMGIYLALAGVIVVFIAIIIVYKKR